LGLSPVTNMMPILRHGLLGGGGPIECTMAWVAVPALSVQADRQRYRHLRSAGGHHVVRYEAVDGNFAADITVDADAVVIDYPGIARRLAESVLLPRSIQR
ncbi:MAG: putative glycolipid-binding domain-containing protein, partial [Acidimicrobiales bacterium]